MSCNPLSQRLADATYVLRLYRKGRINPYSLSGAAFSYCTDERDRNAALAELQPIIAQYGNDPNYRLELEQR